MSSVRIVGNSPHPQFWVTSALPVTHPELKEFESWPISRRKNILRKECLSLLRRRRGRTEAKLYFNHENMLGISVSCRPSDECGHCARCMLTLARCGAGVGETECPLGAGGRDARFERNPRCFPRPGLRCSFSWTARYSGFRTVNRRPGGVGWDCHR